MNITLNFYDLLILNSISILIAIFGYTLTKWHERNFIQSDNVYDNLKARITSSLYYYSNMLSNPLFNEKINDYSEKIIKKREDASEELRMLASETNAFMNWIESRSRFTSLFITHKFPQNDDLESLSKNLIGLSNSMYVNEKTFDKSDRDFVQERIDEIELVMKINSNSVRVKKRKERKDKKNKRKNREK